MHLSLKGGKDVNRKSFNIADGETYLGSGLARFVRAFWVGGSWTWCRDGKEWSVVDGGTEAEVE